MNIVNFEIILNNIEDTIKLAELLAKEIKANDVVALCGTIGTGKTTFSKYFINALHGEQINFHGSPTFTLVQEYHYNGKLSIYHFDWYRIKNVTELKMIGWEEYYQNNGICLIEWADLYPQLLPKNTIYLNFEIIERNRKVKIMKK